MRMNAPHVPDLAQAVGVSPDDVTRAVLLPPLRMLREASVVVSRTLRHWELQVEGVATSPTEHETHEAHPSSAFDRVDDAFDDLGGTPVAARDDDSAAAAAAATTLDETWTDEGGAVESGDPQVPHVQEPVTDVTVEASLGEYSPVESWAEMSLADAGAHLHGLEPQELRALLEYERQHGHRPQYVLLIEQRIAATTA